MEEQTNQTNNEPPTSTTPAVERDILRNTLEEVFPQMIARNKVQQDAYITNDDGTTITFNIDQSAIHNVTLGGNRTLAIMGGKVGQVFVIRLLQDGGGSRTVTWFSTISWAGAAAPTLTTTANRADTFIFLITSINSQTSAATYDGYIVGLNVG